MKLTMRWVLAGCVALGVFGAAVLRGEGAAGAHGTPGQVAKPWIQAKARDLAKGAVARGAARAAVTAKLSAGGVRPEAGEVSRTTAELLQEVGKVLRGELDEVNKKIERLRRKKEEGSREALKDQKVVDPKTIEDAALLQELMDRKGQLEQMISNVMKDAAEEQAGLAPGLKAS